MVGGHAVLLHLAVLVVALPIGLYVGWRRAALGPLPDDPGARRAAIFASLQRLAVVPWIMWGVAAWVPLLPDSIPPAAVASPTYALTVGVTGLGVHLLLVWLTMRRLAAVRGDASDPATAGRWRFIDLAFPPLCAWTPAVLGVLSALLFRVPIGKDVAQAWDVLPFVLGILLGGYVDDRLLLPLLGPRREAAPDVVARLHAQSTRPHPLTVCTVDSGGRGLPNAYAWHAGRQPVIFAIDTLFDALTPPEADAILLHEAGHLEHRHLRTRGRWLLGCLVAGSGLLLLLGAANATTMLVLYGVLRICVMPALYQRQEIQADAFAAERMGEPRTLARALARLHEALWLPEEWEKGEAAMSHPAQRQRLEALRGETRASTASLWSTLALVTGGSMMLLVVVGETVPPEQTWVTDFLHGYGLLGLLALAFVFDRVGKHRAEPASDGRGDGSASMD